MYGQQQDLHLCNFSLDPSQLPHVCQSYRVCPLHLRNICVRPCVPSASLQAALCRACQLLRACLAATESVRSIKTKLTVRRHRSRRSLISRGLSLVLRWCLDCCHYTSRCSTVSAATKLLWFSLASSNDLPAALPLHQLLLHCLSARHSMQLLIQITVLPGGTSSS